METTTLKPHTFTVTCAKCTKQRTYRGETVKDAVREAIKAGWVKYDTDNEARFVCPTCPARRVSK